MTKHITTSEAFRVGATLAGKLIGLIICYLVLGIVADRIFGTAPLGLAAGVFLGTTTGCIVIYRNLRTYLS